MQAHQKEHKSDAKSAESQSHLTQSFFHWFNPFNWGWRSLWDALSSFFSWLNPFNWWQSDYSSARTSNDERSEEIAESTIKPQDEVGQGQTPEEKKDQERKRKKAARARAVAIVEKQAEILIAEEKNLVDTMDRFLIHVQSEFQELKESKELTIEGCQALKVDVDAQAKIFEASIQALNREVGSSVSQKLKELKDFSAKLGEEVEALEKKTLDDSIAEKKRSNPFEEVDEQEKEAISLEVVGKYYKEFEYLVGTLEKTLSRLNKDEALTEPEIQSLQSSFDMLKEYYGLPLKKELNDETAKKLETNFEKVSKNFNALMRRVRPSLLDTCRRAISKSFSPLRNSLSASSSSSLTTSDDSISSDMSVSEIAPQLEEIQEEARKTFESLKDTYDRLISQKLDEKNRPQFIKLYNGLDDFEEDYPLEGAEAFSKESRSMREALVKKITDYQKLVNAYKDALEVLENKESPALLKLNLLVSQKEKVDGTFQVLEKEIQRLLEEIQESRCTENLAEQVKLHLKDLQTIMISLFKEACQDFTHSKYLEDKGKDYNRIQIFFSSEIFKGSRACEDSMRGVDKHQYHLSAPPSLKKFAVSSFSSFFTGHSKKEDVQDDEYLQMEDGRAIEPRSAIN